MVVAIRSRRGRRTAGSVLLSPVDGVLREWAFRLVASVYAVLSAVDCLTTSYALGHGGRERNPLAATLYASSGMGALVVLKAVIVAVILLTLGALPRRVAVWVGTALAAAMAVVVIANLGAIATL